MIWDTLVYAQDWLKEYIYCIECFFKSFSWRYFMLNLTMFTLIIPVWRIHGRDTRSFNLEIIFWQDDNHFLFVISNLIYFMNLVWKGDVNLMLRRQVKNPLVAHISPTHHDGIHGIMGRNLFWISHDNNPMFSIIFWGSGKNFNGFSIVFQASTGKKDWGKIPGPGNLMLDIPLISIFW